MTLGIQFSETMNYVENLGRCVGRKCHTKETHVLSLKSQCNNSIKLISFLIRENRNFQSHDIQQSLFDIFTPYRPRLVAYKNLIPFFKLI